MERHMLNHGVHFIIVLMKEKSKLNMYSFVQMLLYIGVIPLSSITIMHFQQFAYKLCTKSGPGKPNRRKKCVNLIHSYELTQVHNNVLNM